MARKLKLPLTVREAQRLLSRRRGQAWYEVKGEVIPVDLIIARWIAAHRGSSIWYPRDPAKELARFAAQYGPDFVLIPALSAASPKSPSSGESRPKGTDEVRPQSGDPSEDSPYHGGDGASGEVEGGPPSQGGNNEAKSGAEQGSANGRGSAPMEGLVGTLDSGDEPESSAPETGDTSGEGTHQVCRQAENPARERGEGGSQGRSNDAASAPASRSNPGVNHATPNAGDSGEDASMLTGRANSDPVGHARANLDSLTVPARSEDAWPDGQARESGDAVDPASENAGEYRYRSGRGTRQGSRQSRKTHGGVFAELKAAKIDPIIARQARLALARLLEGGETESGPRYDWQEFSERLKTYRPLAPARREEEGRPALLVLADVSGSCASFSGESVLVARAVATLGVPGADVIVVSHSNGYPQEWQVNGGRPRAVPDEIRWGAGGDAEIAAIAWYERTLRRYQIQAIVALGDWDAEWLYRHLAGQPAVRRFVWLDNWSCNYFEHPAARPDKFNEWSGGDWPRAARRKATYVVGCAGAPDFVEGLRLALRGE